MSKVETVVKTINEKLSLSRRGFMKGMLAVGATASLYGCSKGDDTEEVLITDTSLPASDEFANATSTFRYGTSAHNCGGRCVIRAQVVDGRIVRFLTDDSKVDYEGNTFEIDGRNSAQSKACARCRGYKGRLYHPGRLKYPLKQTKKRGDMSGFVRITWEDALTAISGKMNSVMTKYGPEVFHAIYACGNIFTQFQGASYTGLFKAYANNSVGVNDIASALKAIGGGAPYANDYSFHQNAFFGNLHTGYAGSNANANNVADFVNNIVLWGSNIVSTVNPLSNPWVKATQDMKKRNPNAKVWYIGPEMSDSGISIADEWIQIRPYTDNALIMAIIYELIATNKLDVDYIDTMVYGFCDSPAYWVAMEIASGYYNGTATSRGDTTKVDNPYGKPGTIFMSAPSAQTIPDWNWTAEAGTWWVNSSSNEVTTDDKTGQKDWAKITTRWKNNTTATRYAYTNPDLGSIVNGGLVNKVDAVPAGQSLMSYVLGNGTLPAGADSAKWADYSASSTNYVAKQFSGARFTACSYVKPANTKYQTKLDYLTPKTPEWASAITGVPADDIRRLASFFASSSDAGQQILNCWSGGQLKQAEGCYTLFAIQTLNILVKNWGVTGANVVRNPMARNQGTDPKQITPADITPTTWGAIPSTPNTPVISCTQWYNAVKFAYGDKLTPADGNIPGFTPAVGSAYFDDGGVKSLVKWSYTNNNVNTIIDGSGNTFFAWDKNGSAATAGDLGSSTDVKYSGFRFILNTGGNIPLNQHANAIDSMKMYEKLELGTDPVDADKFCLVTFDNFMAPSARYSDYVLPAKTTWEQADFGGLFYGNNIFCDEVIPGPGESKSTWDFTRDLIAKKNPTQLENFAPGGLDFKATFKKAYIDKVSVNKDKAFYRKSWEQFLEKPFTTNKPNYAPTTASKTAAKTAIEAYLATDKTLPLGTTITTITGSSVGYGFIGAGQFAETATCPNPSGRFHVYSGALVWRYENRFSKWHGYLPADKRGQLNADLDAPAGTTNATSDGYKRVLPIPMYFAYQDYFMEAYGLYNSVTTSVDVQNDYPFQLTTTHDKFRAHSSQSENPYLRELTHMTVGGEIYSGNDANTYAISYNPEGNMNQFPSINSLISSTGEGTENASYTEMYMNPDDATRLGIKTGDLLQVENPIGAVRVIARLSNRCVKGFVGLHQGCWFDPRNIGGKIVDVGGNCNTLMASQPSRADHGNAQQSALVNITKVTTA